MRNVILILTLFFSLQSFGQMLKDIKEPKLYVEPFSIKSIKQVWKSPLYDIRDSGIIMVIGGVKMVGLDICVGKETRKTPTSDGWIYRPFMVTGSGTKIILLNK
jgi:hypothetical protein